MNTDIVYISLLLYGFWNPFFLDIDLVFFVVGCGESRSVLFKVFIGYFLGL